METASPYQVPFMFTHFTTLFSLKSLCFLDEAKHQYERSAVRHTENHLGVPCTYSDVLATSHAHMDKTTYH